MIRTQSNVVENEPIVVIKSERKIADEISNFGPMVAGAYNWAYQSTSELTSQPVVLTTGWNQWFLPVANPPVSELTSRKLVFTSVFYQSGNQCFSNKNETNCVNWVGKISLSHVAESER